MKLTIPNILTFIRVLLIPLFVAVIYFPDPWMHASDSGLLAAVIFIVAAITDAFDGFLARKLNQSTAFGAFLDPVADKLMVMAALIVLVDLQRISSVLALIIIGREITISALREWMAQIGKSANIAVSTLGKVKTSAQMVAIPFLLYNQVLFNFIPCHLIGTLCLVMAALLTLISMFYYLRVAVKVGF
ncbi:CDP-diacylglycerol--glycerol-3-phosphate 3-phosphatidyltransferase [Ferrovum sp. JA12]|uniref:CDP-diacylglycerol--glycerol-3-phosphate 3-phosphatidyltransferase n=1 Tax=Ferrovum sp. JA12 TaxID=1356299 RepID=UPI000703AC75|nr:CDP-diacylglycerol--glycerol-3-phosphate 3-phosphatidyltransferase [Ferrovum sp. JA12]KRH78723.1 CDP-diacylglycerol--glycerol-3-phosphate 3-phosphatidyltransferase [Ferrovum sp. JA12]